MGLRRALNVSALAFAMAGAAHGAGWAHHSGAMFEHDKEVTLTGVVKEFQWTNPHSWLQVVASDGGAGAPAEWSIECGSPNTLYRHGWHQSSFSPGDKVTVRIHPMKDGSKGGIFVGATLANGSTLG